MNQELYYIIDLERSVRSKLITYWKDNKRGYTIDVKEAGKYHYDDAKEIRDNDLDERTLIVLEKVIEGILS